jgi:succinate dehydrogenase subunit C
MTRPGEGIYREFHPRWLRQPMSTYWWLGKWPYVKFILRELSSVFVLWFVIFLLMFVRAVGRGPEAYTHFLRDFACNPVVLAVNAVGLFFLTFHSVTWLSLAPQAIVAHIGTKRVPPIVIGAAHFGGWVTISLALIGALIWL